MVHKVISGIQQVGIGVPDVNRAFDWYRKAFGMDVKIFEERAEAALMTRYTNEKVESRHAILAMNMQSGGGMEIWQYTSKVPEKAAFEPALGDLGIFAAKIKCKDVAACRKLFIDNGYQHVGALSQNPEGKPTFFIKDPFGNTFQVVEGNYWFKSSDLLTGGIGGTIIGSTDIDKALQLYRDILGYDQVVYDKSGSFEDLKALPGGQQSMRRVLLRHSQPRAGRFSKLLGPTEIELVQAAESTPRKIFQDRCWGDQGFIHLCFDITGMELLQQECEAKGFPFTVDSSSTFDMGEAAGHFSYIEDPDGTLIEFVETHKVPVAKKWGIYLNLKKRDPLKPLPDWMVKALAINRVKS